MKFTIPPYPSVPHKSGQARISIRGKQIYLGIWGSRESKAKYGRVVAEYAERAELEAEPVPVGYCKVAELVARFQVWAVGRYQKNGKPTSEIFSFRAVCTQLLEFFQDEDTKDFGPKKLKLCRSAFKLSGKYTRETCNEYTRRIRQVFRWGVAEELVPPEVLTALDAVSGLTVSEFGEPDPHKITCVESDRVEAIKNFVLPPVWAMIQLQTLSGMRPGEVVQLRTCDITATDPQIPKEFRGRVWLYRPLSHKLEHLDLKRLIYFGPKAQEILTAWMRPDDLTAYLFSPNEAVKSHNEARRKDTEQRKRKHRTRQRLNDCYNTNSYRRAIQRGCEFAFAMPDSLRTIDPKLPLEQKTLLQQQAAAWRAQHCWHPNQLRHNAGTAILEEFEIETVRAVLGHSDNATSLIYAPHDAKKAAAAAAQIG